jgi:hypothetical protein
MGAMMTGMRETARMVAAIVLMAAAQAAFAFDHSHAGWNALLKQHVVIAGNGHSSRVDYAGFRRDQRALQSYLEGLSAVADGEYGKWSREQRLAFLVNAYNAFTVDLVLTRYPELKSIKDLGSILQSPWKKEFFALLGARRSLDAVEHGLIRAPGSFDEPRIHFAVNCASIGCPMLREEAYVADKLEAQLEEQAMRFLSDRSRNRFEGGKLEVSKLFDWFKEDFGAREQYFAKYARLLADGPEAQKQVAEGRAPLGFLDYDWSLNDVTRDAAREGVRDTSRDARK